MKVLNQSRIPNEVLAPIVRWTALRASAAAKKTFIHLTDGDDEHARRHCCVTADAYPEGGWKQGLNEKHYVAIHVPADIFSSRSYPRAQQDKHPGAPVVRFEHWDEELVETLAHEFQHVSQFERGYVPSSDCEVDGAAEVDAEQFGAAILEEYKVFRKRRLRHILCDFTPLVEPDPDRGTKLAMPAFLKKVGLAVVLGASACGFTHDLPILHEVHHSTVVASVVAPAPAVADEPFIDTGPLAPARVKRAKLVKYHGPLVASVVEPHANHPRTFE